MLVTCYIGFGSNLGDLMENFHTAKASLAALEGVSNIRCSKLYHSEPLTEEPQAAHELPWYLNGVFEVQTSLTLHALFENLQGIEQRMGRTPKRKWDARVIDLDILFYDNVIYSDKELHVPHREIGQRRFVLLPLCDLAPDFLHPEFQISMRDMLNNTDDPLHIRPYQEA